MTPAQANALWWLASWPASRRFHQSTRQVEHAQRQVLAALLHRNLGCDFGRQYNFCFLRNPREFQHAVPLSSYDDLRPWIGRIEEGEHRVLTREPVLLLEPTGGTGASTSGGATKLIPYTRSLQAEFSRAVAPWISDLFAGDNRIMAGPAYWSLSPVGQGARRTRGGVPIGFEEDAQYFGSAQSHLVRALQAVPPCVRLIEDTASFRYATLLFLLRARGLRLISVWNPTFFLLLLDDLQSLWPRLCRDIERGTLCPPAPLPPQVHRELSQLNSADPDRARAIRAAFGSCDRARIYFRLWPQLRVVSCWDEGQAAGESRVLAALLPHARLQGKGLLATEGIVSFPLTGRAGAALAINSHFFEFLPVRMEQGQVQVLAVGAPLLAHELESGRRYSVVLSNGGGLWRYRLGDIVEVVGFENGCPLLKFIAREQTSDFFGEKLHEEHVRLALETLLNRLAIDPPFSMLACEKYLSGAAYTLFIESETHDERLRLLGRELEGALRENFHYSYCRRLEQLQALRVFRIQSGGRESFLASCVARGQRAGDVKPVVLHPGAGWGGVFSGQLL